MDHLQDLHATAEGMYQTYAASCPVSILVPVGKLAALCSFETPPASTA